MPLEVLRGALLEQAAIEDKMPTLHLVHYLVPVAVPLLLICAVIGRNLDKILEHPGRARTKLVIATVAVSVIVGIGTLIVRHWGS